MRSRSWRRKNIEQTSLKDQLQDHAALAIAGLVHIMRTCKSDKLRASAANLLLDRGYGRPPPSMDDAVWDAASFPKIKANMTLQDHQALYSALRNVSHAQFRAADRSGIIKRLTRKLKN
jgi:hypothetical protein